jgi:hypothetical protein
LATGDDTTLLWAPMDSDRLYALRPEPPASAPDEAAAVLAGPPAPLRDASALLRDRVDALDLGEDERFAGLGLVSEDRVWIATDRSVYLFDRSRELYLLDAADLPEIAGAGGGDLVARGPHVLVVGPSAIWSFLAR